MATPEAAQSSESIHALLGLPEAATASELEASYWRLRAHVELRASASRDPAFVRARQAELALLHRAAERIGVGAGRSSAAAPADAAAAPVRRGRSWPWAAFAAATAAAALAALITLWLRGPTEPAVAAPPPLPASIAALAEPAGALLEISDAQEEHVVVRVPADGRPHDIEAGLYRLHVAHPDCPDTWSREQRFAAGDSREYAPRLCRGRGQLVIRSNVSDDRVQIDGIDVGSTGVVPRDLAVGGHDVSVQKQGYELWSARVKIAPEQELTLHAELAPSAQPSGARPAAPAGTAPRPPPEQAAAAELPAPSQRPPRGASAGAPPGGDKLLRTGKGGSKSWHDAVRQRLVSGYDRNGSGSLDTAEEVTSIPCEVWHEVEESYETGGLSVGMARLYGFDGSDAPANTLGITKEMRGYTYDRMVQCGLETRL